MQLYDIALRGLRRRAGRMALLVFSLAVGVAMVVALVAITRAMRASVSTRLDEYGANILIVPRASDLSLSYGGITVASAAYDVGEIRLSDLDRLGTIKNARNVSVVAPKLLTAVQGQAIAYRFRFRPMPRTTTNSVRYRTAFAAMFDIVVLLRL